MKGSDWVGIIVGFISSLLMVLLTRTKAYIDGSSNTLMIILLLFALSMIGLGISKLYNYLFGDDEGVKR